MSKKKNGNVETVVDETVLNDATETTETNEEPVTNVAKGRVANCNKLNVRAEADAEAKILGTVKVDSELEIDLAKSNKSFYAVTTKEGKKGYCMKKYVKIVR